MIIFVNEKNEIKGVGATSDSTLTPHEINDDMNPFNGMSEAKICCYKATVIGGRVTMMTPYVDSRLLDHIEQLGKQGDTNTSDISDNREGIMETFEQTITNSTDLEDVRTAIIELYEMIGE